MMSLLHDAEFWVLLGFIIFIGLAWKKVSLALGSSLDSRVPRIAAHSLFAVPRTTCSYQARWKRCAQVRDTSPRTIDEKAPRSTAVPM